jgi:hypothetical protein
MHVIRAVITAAALAQLLRPLPAQGRDPLAVYRDWNVPRWALGALDAQFRAQYEWYDRVNPFYQRGDFDGDGQVDLALLIRHKTTRKVGIAFVHRASRAVHVVGAGTPLGNGGDDFGWLGVWRVDDGSALREVPGFRGEVLYVEKPESAGGLIYWDGTRYQWVQRGD